MKVMDSVALVTGAGQGIGRGFVEVLLERGAARIYATARQPAALEEVAALDPGRVVPLKLDVTDAADRAAAARQAHDVTLLVNNAGIPGSEDPSERRFLAAGSLDDARWVMETNCFAQAEMCRAFLPALLRGREGAIINILSIGAHFCTPAFATYSASKAAAAIMTQGIRAELMPQGILVCGVYTAGVDTRMSTGGDRPRVSPAEHARQVLTAAEAGVEDIYAGYGAAALHAEIMRDPKAAEQRRTAMFLREQNAGKQRPAT